MRVIAGRRRNTQNETERPKRRSEKPVSYCFSVRRRPGLHIARRSRETGKPRGPVPFGKFTLRLRGVRVRRLNHAKHKRTANRYWVVNIFADWGITGKRLWASLSDERIQKQIREVFQDIIPNVI